MYPNTILGRVVAVVAAIVGICLIAVLVTAVSNLLKMDADEDMAMNFLRRGPLRTSRFRIAARVVHAFMRYTVARMRAARAASGGARGLSLRAVEGSEGAPPPPPRDTLVVPHSAVRPLAFALDAWRAHLYSWSMSKRKADTTEVIAANCDTIMAQMTQMNEAVKALQADVAVALKLAAAGQQAAAVVQKTE